MRYEIITSHVTRPIFLLTMGSMMGVYETSTLPLRLKTRALNLGNKYILILSPLIFALYFFMRHITVKSEWEAEISDGQNWQKTESNQAKLVHKNQSRAKPSGKVRTLGYIHVFYTGKYSKNQDENSSVMKSFSFSLHGPTAMNPLCMPFLSALTS